MKKGLIGLAIITVLGIGGYFWYQNHQAEQNRLRKESYEAMIQMMVDAPREMAEMRAQQNKEAEERRQRIEAGTAKIEEINEVRKDGSRVFYTLVDGKREGDSFIWYKSGQKSVESIYKDGRKISYISFYDNEKNTKQGTIYSGPGYKEEEHRWDRDGNLIYQTYVSEKGPNDRKNNWVKGWYEDGSISSEIKYNPETDFVDRTEWYPNGQMKLFRSEGFSSGREAAITKTWYENGQQSLDEMNVGRFWKGWRKEWNKEGELIVDEIWSYGTIDREKHLGR
ncbi:hypothetical protein [Wohlfahrtiimonas populi]|uniref:hypothetical protein n=1 Tax=Wohlfahrtiimonas populi TaxID=1940240 RepID=UPI00098D4D02|nr:hypothetical protein [Wohlfahrtiimonas populi]